MAKPRAWRCAAAGLTSAVFAETRGKAIATTVRSANDAGFAVRWVDVRATRWPELDELADCYRTGNCWPPDLIQRENPNHRMGALG